MLTLTPPPGSHTPLLQDLVSVVTSRSDLVVKRIQLTPQLVNASTRLENTEQVHILLMAAAQNHHGDQRAAWPPRRQLTCFSAAVIVVSSTELEMQDRSSSASATRGQRDCGKAGAPRF